MTARKAGIILLIKGCPAARRCLHNASSVSDGTFNYTREFWRRFGFIRLIGFHFAKAGQFDSAHFYMKDELTEEQKRRLRELLRYEIVFPSEGETLAGNEVAQGAADGSASQWN